MKNLLFLILSIIIFTSCNNKSHSQAKEPEELSFNNYSNEYFSIEYPVDWEYEEEINSDYDTIPGMSTGIRTTFYPKDLNAPFQTICVQKSSMFHVFSTPEEWRDLSVEMKNFNDEYIGTVESMMLDSIKFGPYPAAMAGFVVELGGDTIIHKQMVVVVDEDVYYLNNSFDWNDKGTLQKFGDAILATVRFKE